MLKPAKSQKELRHRAADEVYSKERAMLRPERSQEELGNGNKAREGHGEYRPWRTPSANARKTDGQRSPVVPCSKSGDGEKGRRKVSRWSEAEDAELMRRVRLHGEKWPEILDHSSILRERYKVLFSGMFHCGLNICN